MWRGRERILCKYWLRGCALFHMSWCAVWTVCCNPFALCLVCCTYTIIVAFGLDVGRELRRCFLIFFIALPLAIFWLVLVFGEWCYLRWMSDDSKACTGMYRFRAQGFSTRLFRYLRSGRTKQHAKLWIYFWRESALDYISKKVQKKYGFNDNNLIRGDFIQCFI